MARVLIIGDTHCPGMRRGYVDFLKRVADNYDVSRVVHIGDLVDWASISFHEKSPALSNATVEYAKALRQVASLARAFPQADWLVGNHDALTERQAVGAGLPPHIHAAVAGAYIRSALVTDLPPEDVDGLIEPWLSDAGRASFYRQFAQADERYTAEVEPAYGDVRCPVRILWGRDDPWIPLARGEALHTLMPHAGFEVLDGLGHLPQLEDPLRVLDSLLAFLTAD